MLFSQIKKINARSCIKCRLRVTICDRFAVMILLTTGWRRSPARCNTIANVHTIHVYIIRTHQIALMNTLLSAIRHHRCPVIHVWFVWLKLIRNWTCMSCCLQCDNLWISSSSFQSKCHRKLFFMIQVLFCVHTGACPIWARTGVYMCVCAYILALDSCKSAHRCTLDNHPHSISGMTEPANPDLNNWSAIVFSSSFFWYCFIF